MCDAKLRIAELRPPERERPSPALLFGRYEELPDVAEWQSVRVFAHQLLKPGDVKAILHDAPRPLVPIFCRAQIFQMTGHRATSGPESPAFDTRLPMTASSETGWRYRLLRQVCGRRKPGEAGS